MNFPTITTGLRHYRLGLAGLIFLFWGCASSGAPEAMSNPAPTPPPPAGTQPPPASATPTPPQVEAAPAPTPAPTPIGPMGVDLDTVRAGRFDNGKMWTFEYAPVDYLESTYDFRPEAEWFERARLAALRIPSCSASFVSPHGLVMTNHHCAREGVSAVSRPGEDLLDNGFYARSLEDERPLEDFHADQLIAIVDVSEAIDAAVPLTLDGSARADALEAATDSVGARIEGEHGGEEAGIMVEVIALWNGAKHSAYVFKRYEDVRLVMAPELQLGYFGGDPDNFTYPRYALDMSFLRVYDDDGTPLRPENHFAWSRDGVTENELIFIIGNPGSTSRLQTVAELEYRRTIGDPALLGFVSSRIDALQAYYDRDPEAAEALDLRNSIFSLLNSEKAFTGVLGGLNDPVLMARRRDAERSFREAIERDPGLSARYGSVLDELAAVQRDKAEFAAETNAFAGLGAPDYTSAMLMRGFFAFQYLAASQGGAPADAINGVKEQFLGIGQQPRLLQQYLLTARLTDFVDAFGDTSAVARQILAGRTPWDAAGAILEASALTDSTRAVAALESGGVSMRDPAIQMIQGFLPRFGAFQQRISQLTDRESALAAQLGRARFDVYGTEIPPDATFSLRIADGVVSSYEYNGTVAPYRTTFYGLYDHYYSYRPQTDWDLPDRWLDPPASFDLSTPLNFVSTADIIGGNSGSPVVNRNLEVVGLVFDGNIESLPGDFIYVPDRNRSVAVDARGILEALDEIYDADRLVLELTAGRLAATEAEADAVR